MKILKAKEIAYADRKAIQEIGVPSLVLMENASLSVARVIREKFGENLKGTGSCSKGNNGGDGVACAST